MREEGVAGERRLLLGGERSQGVLADEMLDRVVAEEGGEQDRDRGTPAASWAAAAETPCACRPSLSVEVSVEESPITSSVKKIPIEITWAEFWKVWFMPPPAPRSPGGRLFITAARLGEANMPIEAPESSRIAANTG